MIFKLKFSGKTEYAQAKNQLHLLQQFNKEYDDFDDIEEVEEISNEEAKTIMLKNCDYNEEDPDDMSKEFSLWSSAVGNEFLIIGSTEWD